MLARRRVNSRRASRDLEEIWAYIGQDDPRSADDVINDIYHEIENLCDFPGMGSERPELTTKSYRFIPIHSYLIVYTYTNTTLRVVRVLSAYRDVRSILR